MSILIKNGLISFPEEEFIGDIFIDKDRIQEKDEKLPKDAKNIIDAKGKFIIPGGVNVHTHLDTPYGNIKLRDNYYTGTLATTFGGTTTIIDFPIQSKEKNLNLYLING